MQSTISKWLNTTCELLIILINWFNSISEQIYGHITGDTRKSGII